MERYHSMLEQIIKASSQVILFNENFGQQMFLNSWINTRKKEGRHFFIVSMWQALFSNLLRPSSSFFFHSLCLVRICVCANQIHRNFQQQRTAAGRLSHSRMESGEMGVGGGVAMEVGTVGPRRGHPNDVTISRMTSRTHGCVCPGSAASSKGERKRGRGTSSSSSLSRPFHGSTTKAGTVGRR